MDKLFSDDIMDAVYMELKNTLSKQGDYFIYDEKDIINHNYTLENLLDSFEEDSQIIISMKVALMKKIKNNQDWDKDKIFNFTNSYINKYFYNIKLVESIEKDISEFNKVDK